MRMGGFLSRNGKTNKQKKTCNIKSSSIRRNNKVIKITPTGWANIKEYISVVEGEYIVPYSSHSNYKEIEAFVNSLRPAVLKCVVRENRSNYQKVHNVKQFNSYMFTLQSLKQTGYELLLKKYTNIETASEEYLSLMQPGVMEEIAKRLGLKISQTKVFEEDSRRFDMKMSQIIKARNKNKLNKGVKLKRPEENEELTQEDVEFIKENHDQPDSNTKSTAPNTAKEMTEDSFSKPMNRLKLNCGGDIKYNRLSQEEGDDKENTAEQFGLPPRPNVYSNNTDFDNEFK